MNANETEALPCARGCGLFGTRQNNNLCSLCYKESVLQQAAKVRLEPKTETETERSPVCPQATTTSPVAAKEPVGVKRRCETCQRKVGVLGFKCRCGHMFCGSHRYPEEHSCAFDHKQSGRLSLAKQLPLIRTDKLQRL
ncbi:unnamed protein product [Microthlaspi erraticum]|uniref:AN1-type domain-containing protein n=1 Tax=Microthlaspi erraticum TaxID=1685480 RepID=A0A6D2L126_9BRAS|nr:unnamed protein product [Microthlaspi erraticum]